jgi:membrane protein YqaA with SNARE-associated domain
VILSARMKNAAWIVPLLATAGSLAGAWLTFWMGVKVGEKGLERHIPQKRLERIRARIKRSGALALAVLDLIPPPFPFTPFVLAAGALDVPSSTFFITLAVCRLARFGIEAALARRYGAHILRWLESDLVREVVSACIVLAMALTAVTIVRLIRTSSPRAARPARA